MKVYLFFLLIIGLVFTNLGCSESDAPDYSIKMYVSLGIYSVYPVDSGYEGDNIADLSNNYVGRSVVFSVEGVDPNTDIAETKTLPLTWINSDPSNTRTAFVENTFLLKTSVGNYPGGSYKFRIFIDWNDNRLLDTGDLIMSNYSILADKDNNDTTEPETVNSWEYLDNITYNASDFSVTINDPLNPIIGIQWKVTSVSAGFFGVY